MERATFKESYSPAAGKNNYFDDLVTNISKELDNECNKAHPGYNSRYDFYKAELKPLLPMVI
jgi:hypothetical protein